MSTFIDHREISRFDTLAETWWQPAGPMWPLHRLNELRAPYICDQAVTHLLKKTDPLRPLHGLKLLDIGCGAGLLSESMARLGASVTALDPSPRNIDIACNHAHQQRLAIDYRLGSLESLRPGELFDLVLNMEVVEHVEDPMRFISASCARTRPGGLHVLATINRTPWSWLIAIVGAEYALRWLPKGTHQWSKFVKPSELEQRLVRHHHHIRDRKGVFIDPLSKRFSLTGRSSVNYMVVAQRAR